MSPFIVSDRSFSDVLENLGRSQPAPPDETILITALVALALVVLRAPWLTLRGVVTIAHEGGHALVAVATGRRVQGIRLHSDTSGVTFWRGRANGLGAVASIAAGYPAPALLGLAASAFLAFDRITALLWFSLLLLALILIGIRNLYGVLSVLATAAVIFAVSWFGAAAVQGVFAYAFTWFLLLASIRPVVELQQGRRYRRGPTSDADQLAGLTRIPALVWVGFFALVSLGCLALAVRWILF